MRQRRTIKYESGQSHRKIRRSLESLKPHRKSPNLTRNRREGREGRRCMSPVKFRRKKVTRKFKNSLEIIKAEGIVRLYGRKRKNEDESKVQRCESALFHGTADLKLKVRKSAIKLRLSFPPLKPNSDSPLVLKFSPVELATL